MSDEIEGEGLAADALPLDPGICRAVEVLRAAGIETFESCEGGTGHAFPESTVRFHGGCAEGFRAFTVVAELALPVREIRRTWDVIDGAPTGPCWELTFAPIAWRADEFHRRADAQSVPQALLDEARAKAIDGAPTGPWWKMTFLPVAARFRRLSSPIRERRREELRRSWRKVMDPYRKSEG